jgi:hypothetical protein
MNMVTKSSILAALNAEENLVELSPISAVACSSCAIAFGRKMAFVEAMPQANKAAPKKLNTL